MIINFTNFRNDDGSTISDNMYNKYVQEVDQFAHDLVNTNPPFNEYQGSFDEYVGDLIALCEHLTDEEKEDIEKEIGHYVDHE